ncbi:MAG: acyl-CoA dehydrogenase family protein [Burkholderiaceae bacterium]|nr:acyl-CoA dehydrogenase family protein [Burkholderiaceae bacterium]
MNLDFSAEDQRFREQVKDWLADHVPRTRPPATAQGQREYLLEWQRIQHEGGWAGISWPKAYGGAGLPLQRQVIWHEEYARAGAPRIDCLFVGLNHAGPTLIARASEAQKLYHLPRILKGEVVWCQGFSEPGAGSDLASLRTHAVIDGDELVINGSKIWTSFAHVADWQELLVRTDPTLPRHKGISWVICDMHSPGITIRPIRSMSGEQHFNEVFYDNVRVPLSNVVGALNDGWSVAMSTLSFERGTAFMGSQIELARQVERLIELAGRNIGFDGRPAIEDDAIASELAQLRAEVAALRALAYLNISRGMRQDVPGPEGTVNALFYGELAKRISRVALKVCGSSLLERSEEGHDWPAIYLHIFHATIAGGTSEIRRNIIGERVLGLPRGK